MKNELLFSLFVFAFIFASAQNPLVKKWDYRFGGAPFEERPSIEQTNDGGYIIGGSSRSRINGDKTQDNWDTINNTSDYWIVKTDSLGSKQWDKRFGGTWFEVLSTVQQTSDLGYILAGSGWSKISGDKTQYNWDGSNNSPDYWIVKVDESGNKQWDKRFGGTEEDELTALKQTKDRGYILGGFSRSPIGGDKTQANRDITNSTYDYWVVKINALGNKEWDRRFGGNQEDKLYDLLQTKDGGYLLGGYSGSGINGDKTQSVYDSTPYKADYWIVKIDSAGNKEWDKRYGGNYYDALFSMLQTNDGGFILGGTSSSDSSEDKTEPSRSYTDYWIVKIDSTGGKQWDKTFGGNYVEEFTHIGFTIDGGYLLSGTSYSPLSGDKSEDTLGIEQSWIIKTDQLGNKQWDKTIFTNGHDEDGYAIQTIDECYTIINTTNSGIGGYKTQTNHDPTNQSFDYWMVKFCDTTSATAITDLKSNNYFSIYPNPATNTLKINYDGAAISQINIYNITGQLMLVVKQPLNNAIDISTLSIGLYMAEIKTKETSVMRKWVKM